MMMISRKDRCYTIYIIIYYIIQTFDEVVIFVTIFITLSSLQCLYFARFFDIVDGQHSHGVYKGAGVMHKKMFKEIQTDDVPR